MKNIIWCFILGFGMEMFALERDQSAKDAPIHTNVTLASFWAA